MIPTILDLCGGTGAWSKPYKDAGYSVEIIDPIQGSGTIRLFTMTLPKWNVHGILAAPPCTEFASSGARWWKNKDPQLLVDAVEVVYDCLAIIDHYKPVWWALENPVGRLPGYIGPYAYTFQPCDYGDPYTKRTCMWGNHNRPTGISVEPTEGSKLHRLPPSTERARLRSIIPPGFAKAFFLANP